jgi:hypothetical protein
MRQLVVSATWGLLLASAPQPSAQLPLAPPSKAGQTVTPAFEGWYPNGDGTFSISFGYLNRNSAEVVEIPIGADNAIEPGQQNQGQPTHFQPGRHWGVFAIRVPADFRDKSVVWTLKNRGESYSIPGRLHPNWQIDALEGEAGSGNTPPVLKFDETGPEGSGPLGIMAGPLAATVGQPLTLTVWARDDGRTSGSVASSGREAVPVTLTWFKHQGPGDVTFGQPTSRVPASGGSMTTTATFNQPGPHVVRVRANDASGIAGAGHAQCCWTNGFVRIAVASQ